MLKPDLKLTYNDNSHAYYLNGKRCKSVTTVAKIVSDSYNIQKWHERMVGMGVTIDSNLRENIAANVDDKERLNDLCEDAKKVAKAHHAADRGTQMHRVLELVLLDQEDKLMTEQQRADAEVLKRTLDRYHLTPYQKMAEQFVAWPHYTVAGRFDAILETANNDLILTDLKSGPNAVAYPQSTCAQLALYARAPHVSATINQKGSQDVVTEWTEMPGRLDRSKAFVLLVPPDAEIGTLHELDIEHGWAAAQLALRLIEWRKKLGYGKDAAREIESIPARPAPPTWESLILDAADLNDLRNVWHRALELGELTPSLRMAATRRSKELTA